MTEPQIRERGAAAWLLAPAVAVVMTMAVALLAVVLVGADGDGGSGAAAGSGEPVVLEVELGDLYVEPSSVEVPAGTELVVNVRNAGATPHDLKLGGETGTAMLDPGEEERVSLGVMEEPSEAWCTVPGHKEAGMVLAIEVTGAPAGSGGDHGDATDPAGDAAVIDWQATPGPDWEPFDPKLEPAPAGTEHQIDFSMTEEVIEVAPGVTQEVWVFNGRLPGPTLRGKVGDVFTVTLTNDGEIGHSLDFHASKVAWDDEMRTLQPGESLVYQFQAKHAGVWMYHCGTAPALHHIGNGMFGAVVIDPPDLAPVDHELIFVQSELYLGPEGEPGDLTKMQEVDFDAVVFNGYANQYKHAPIQVEVGERVRAYVLDAGPSENSAFHVVGTIFDTAYKEGDYHLRPGAGQGGSQALDLQPSQGGFVEFTFDEDGLYPIVTHKFSNVGIGALGIFAVGDVDRGEVAH
ncbi:MAG: multicopper oxidase domain-containing protein [Acidimicrobiia bacterium]